MSKNICLACILTFALVACESEDGIISQVATQLGAANENPCAEQLEFQNELNGSPDDTRQSAVEVEGEIIVTEEHWYADSEMILFYTYADGGEWCNVWNENGVSWN